jgi:hypothetical protein
MFNATFDAVEERTKAGQFGPMIENAPDLELEFDARFAKRLREAGYVPVPGKHGFQLAGVPQSVIDKFSRRRDQIEAAAAAKGITDAKGKHRLTRSSRENKLHDVGLDVLRKEWDTRLTAAERAALEKVRNKEITPGPVITAEQSVDYVIKHRFQREDFVSLRELKRDAVYHGIGHVMPGEVQREIDAAIKRERLIVVENRDGTQGVTTKEALQAQEKMLAFAREGRGQFAPLIADIKALDLEGEQRTAALHVLQSRDRVIGIRGGAGTGKTTMLKRTVKTIYEGLETALKNGAADRESEYSEVYAFAPSATASRGQLRKAGFEYAETLATLLVNEKLQEKVHNQVILVDEAGMISTRDMNRLFDVAEKQNARVVLLGDYRQHASVDAGDAFRLLKSEGVVQFAELKQNRRQKEKNHRAAVDAIGDGTPEGAATGVKILSTTGAIIEEKDREKLLKRLVGDYLEAVDKGSTGLIIGTTNAEGYRVTKELRQRLRKRGLLGHEETAFIVREATGWTDAQKEDGRNYQPGMVVEFHKTTAGVRKSVKGKRETTGGFGRGEAAVVLQGGANVLVQRQDGTRAFLPMQDADRFQVYAVGAEKIALRERVRITKNGYALPSGKDEKPVRINNGDIFTVDQITPEGHIRTTDGKLIGKDYGHITLGYTDTSYQSQGKTVDYGFIAVDPRAQKATNQTQWYVSASRSEYGVKVYVDDKKAALAAAQRSSTREAAIELVRNAKEQPLQEKLFDMHRAVRYLQTIKETVVREVTSWRDRILPRNEGRSYA